MAQVNHIRTPLGQKVEIFVTGEELLKALGHQIGMARHGKGLEQLITEEEYCLTFDED